MTNEELIEALERAEGHILLHSLGLNYGDNAYRNHFVTGEGSVDYPHCMALVGKGLMVKRAGNELSGGDDVFFVTEDGKQAAAALRAKGAS